MRAVPCQDETILLPSFAVLLGLHRATAFFTFSPFLSKGRRKGPEGESEEVLNGKERRVSGSPSVPRRILRRLFRMVSPPPPPPLLAAFMDCTSIY